MELELIKNYLRVTWEHDDVLLADLIERGQAYLNARTGADLDFGAEGLARSLLLHWVRYAYNNATEYFEENFRQDLYLLKLSAAVQEMEDADNED